MDQKKITLISVLIITACIWCAGLLEGATTDLKILRAGQTISSLVRVSDVVTVNLTADYPNNNLKVGQAICISGAADSSFDSETIITAVISQSEFTYDQAGPDGSTTGGVAGGSFTGQAIASITRASDVVTVTLAANFPYDNLAATFTDEVYTKIQIDIMNVADSSFNGTFNVGTVVSQTEFTYSQTGPDASSSGGTAGWRYKRLMYWEQGEHRDLVAADEIAMLHLYADWPPSAPHREDYEPNRYGPRWTVDADHYIHWTCPESERHHGIAGTGFIHKNKQWRKLNLGEQYFRLEWVEVAGTTDSRFANIGVPANSIVSNCIVHDSAGVGFDLGSTSCRIYNSIAYKCGGTGFDMYGTAYNCTAYANGGLGFSARNTASTSRVINCISIDNTGQDFTNGNSSGDWEDPSSNNVSSDGSAPGSPGLVFCPLANESLATVKFVSTAAGSEDLHLQAGSVAIDGGTDTSSLFTLDIDEETRIYPFDCGFDEVPPPPISISGTVSGLLYNEDLQVGLSGTWTDSVTTDGTGFFEFIVYWNGGYSVTPDSAAGYSFDSSSRSVSVTGGLDVTNVNFIATADDLDFDGLPDPWEYLYFGSRFTYNGTDDPDGDGTDNAGEFSHGTDPTFAPTISGAIAGLMFSEVIDVDLTGTETDSTAVNGSGAFSFIVSNNGSYTVTPVPTGTGYTFTNASETVTITGTHITAVNFTANAQDADGDTLLDPWEIHYFGNTTSNTAAGDPDGDGVNNGGEQTNGTDPTFAPHISGTISGLLFGETITVNLTGTETDSDTTDGSGAFDIIVSNNGGYTVTPAPGASAYTFTPTYRDVAMSGSTITGVNFTAVPDDTDIDGLPDPWEIHYFTNITSNDGTLDPDSDGVDNAGEYANNTDPTFAPQISGTVSGLVYGENITMNLTGTKTDATTVNGSGAFTFTVSANGSYTITPAAGTGYSFTPASSTVTMTGAHIPGVNFTAAVQDSDSDTLPDPWEILHFGNTTSQNAAGDPDNDGDDNAAEYANGTDPNVALLISGTITGLLYDEALPLDLTGAAVRAAATDAAGDYTFAVSQNGAYTVTPDMSGTGYSVSPASSGVTMSGTNITGVNFTATALDSEPDGLPDPWEYLYFLDPGIYDGSDDPDGDLVDNAGEYANGTNPTFAPHISGTISGLMFNEAITVNCTGTETHSANAAAGGAYSITVSNNGSYTVTPTSTGTGYTFTNASETVTMTGAHITAVNFTANIQDSDADTLPDPWEIRYFSTITSYDQNDDPDLDGDSNAVEYANGTNPSVALLISGTITGLQYGEAITVNLTGTAARTTATDGSGAYTLAVSKSGGYTVTPVVTATGYTVAPVNRAVTMAAADVTGVDFAVTVQDADSDTLPDPWECLYFGDITSNDASDNPDGDQLDNAIEYDYGTDPTVNDPVFLIAGTFSGLMFGEAIAVDLTGTAAASTTANAVGNYGFLVATDGPYTITPDPTGTGYAFTPPSDSVTMASANITGINFAATAQDNDGDTLPDPWEIHYFGNTAATAAGDPDLDGTDNAGEYANATDPTFAPTISGAISGLMFGEAIAVDLSGTETRSTAADSAGDYSLTVSNNGSYTVTPVGTGTGYTFTNTSETVTMAGAHITAVNFSATILDADSDTLPDPWEIHYFGDTTSNIAADDPDGDGADNGTEYAAGTDPTKFLTVSGTVTGLMYNESISLGLTGMETGAADADAAGDYVITVYHDGGYTVTPQAAGTGYLFSPVNYSFAVTGVSVTGVNFTAAVQDADGDTLPDPWEYLHFGDTGTYGWADDPDSDGTDNADEYANGTDPLFAPVISGTITGLLFSEPVPVDLTGTVTASDMVDGAGQFSFTVSQNGPYAVTPSPASTGYTFIPVSCSVTMTGAAVTDADFTAVPADVDGDTLPDPWEIHYFVDTFVNDAWDDPDFDGIINSEEYTYGTNPLVPNPIRIISGAISGLLFGEPITVYISGTSTGTRQVNTSGVYGFVVYADGDYTLTPDPAETRYSFSPLSRDVTLAGTNQADIDFTATPLDNDTDTLLDAWEVHYFGDTTSNAAADDPDSDGRDNAAEYAAGTDPTAAPVSSGGGGDSGGGCLPGTTGGLHLLLAGGLLTALTARRRKI